MAIDLNDILERTHKPENEDLYHKLINHTSEVSGGQDFIRNVDRARVLEAKKDEPFSSVEYSKIISKLNKWLNDNDWK